MASNTTSSASCGICSELYKEPHMLMCLHSFCKQCLQKTLEKEGSSIKCPMCGESSPVPNNAVDSLPKDHRKIYEAEIAEYDSLIKGDSSVPCDHCEKGRSDVFCCDCCEFLCEKCADHHRTWRKTRNHELISCAKKSSKDNILKKIHKPLVCHIHSNETLDYYCNTCCCVLCFRCATVKHKDHAFEDLESVQVKEKTGLVTYLEKTESARSKVKSSIAQVEKVIQRVHANHKEADQKIEDAFAQLQRRLKARKDALLVKSTDIALGKETALTLQCEELKLMENAIDEICMKLESVSQEYTAVEMLSAKQPVSNRAQQLLDRFDKCSLVPCKLDRMTTSLEIGQLENDIDNFGAVTGGSLPANSTVCIVKHTATVGKKRELVLTAKGVDGKPYPYGGEPVKATLTLMDSSSESLHADMIDNKNGTYSLSVTPQSAGEHKLSITISSEHVEGSPYVIYVRQPRNYTSLSSNSYARVFSVSSNAGDVAVGDNGHVYVAVCGYHCISVFDQNGSNIRTIGSTNGSCGSGDGQFYSPYGITVKGDIMYVVDASNNRIQKLTTSGEFINKFGGAGSGDGQLSGPRGIALDTLGRVFVSEYSNNRVSVFSADGTFSHHIQGDSSNQSALSNPWGLAFDNDDNLHVANYSSNSVKVFTPDGTFIKQYGNGVIHYPAGIAIDDEGNSFIGEYCTMRSIAEGSRARHSKKSHVAEELRVRGSNKCHDHLLILNAQHQQIRKIKRLKLFTGVCLDRDGFVYICDYDNCQVYKY